MPILKRNIKELLNQDFMSVLEYHLSKTFKNSDDKSINSLWCDGIDHTGIVKENNVLETRAWIGKDGQTEYNMVINFSDEFLNKKTSLPSINSLDWIKIEINNK